jgi:hypothetical protein
MHSRVPSPLIAAVVLMAAANCACQRTFSMPQRPAPFGYPSGDAAQMARLPNIPQVEFARALDGRKYRVRYGMYFDPNPHGPVDARSGEYGAPTRGPFELDIRVAEADVQLRELYNYPKGAAQLPPAQRVMCLDIRPHLPVAHDGWFPVVLDAMPLDASPPLPLAFDAVTGARLPEVDAATFEGSERGEGAVHPCDMRTSERVQWDANLLRRHRLGLHD